VKDGKRKIEIIRKSKANRIPLPGGNMLQCSHTNLLIRRDGQSNGSVFYFITCCKLKETLVKGVDFGMQGIN
jgi:hypothetical protein